MLLFIIINKNTIIDIIYYYLCVCAIVNKIKCYSVGATMAI